MSSADKAPADLKRSERPRGKFSPFPPSLHAPAIFGGDSTYAMRGRTGHELAAGAIGGSAIVLGAAAGPLWAAVFELASAAVTAGIAAHAIELVACDADVSSHGVLYRVARREAKRGGAPLAAQALDVACLARAGDARALRSAAMLIGRASSGNARGIALQLLSAWCAPLREIARFAAPFGAARAALEGATFVSAMKQAAFEELSPTTSAEVVVLAHQNHDTWEAAAHELHRDRRGGLHRVPHALRHAPRNPLKKGFGESFSPVPAGVPGGMVRP